MRYYSVLLILFIVKLLVYVGANETTEDILVKTRALDGDNHLEESSYYGRVLGSKKKNDSKY